RALANELYGRFWLERGQPRVAAAFLGEARYGYAQWGASAKVRDLDRRYQGLLEPARARSAGAMATRPTPLTTTVGRPAAFDTLTVIRAAQVLSGEIQLGRLL